LSVKLFVSVIVPGYLLLTDKLATVRFLMSFFAFEVHVGKRQGVVSGERLIVPHAVGRILPVSGHAEERLLGDRGLGIPAEPEEVR
jgi:hypothetical protein